MKWSAERVEEGENGVALCDGAALTAAMMAAAAAVSIARGRLRHWGAVSLLHKHKLVWWKVKQACIFGVRCLALPHALQGRNLQHFPGLLFQLLWEAPPATHAH